MGHYLGSSWRSPPVEPYDVAAMAIWLISRELLRVPCVTSRMRTCLCTCLQHFQSSLRRTTYSRSTALRASPATPRRYTAGHMNRRLRTSQLAVRSAEGAAPRQATRTGEAIAALPWLRITRSTAVETILNCLARSSRDGVGDVVALASGCTSAAMLRGSSSF